MVAQTDDTLGEAIKDAQHQAIADNLWKGHRRQHKSEKLALETARESDNKALTTAREVDNREWHQHDTAHQTEHKLHDEKHAAEGMAVKTALDAVARERTIHAEAHEREHLSHQRVHEMNEDAVSKAGASVDERLRGMNEFRGQLRDQQATFATRDSVGTLSHDTDRRFAEMNTTMLQHFQNAEKTAAERYETVRSSIVALERGAAEGKAKGLGQGAMVAYIVTAVGLVGGILGIIIVLSNVATRSAT